MKSLIFFCIASAILLFSIVTINIAPAIGKLIGSDWMEDSCKFYSDQYDNNEEKDSTYFGSQELKDKQLKRNKKALDRCNRKQAMVGLEYTSLNINLIFGLVCAFLGLLKYLNIGNLGKITAFIGLGGGAIGFVLTFVYIIESGLVFDDIADPLFPKIDADGAVYEWNDSKKRYTCIFYKKDDEDSIYLKYSDYGNSYLNYRKDIVFLLEEKNYKYLQTLGCHDTITQSTIDAFYSHCKNLDELDPLPTGAKSRYYENDPLKEVGVCNKKYYITDNIATNPTKDNEKKILYDRWLTTIIISCFISLLNICLAIFGFLLFKESSSGSSGSVAIK